MVVRKPYGIVAILLTICALSCGPNSDNKATSNPSAASTKPTTTTAPTTLQRFEFNAIRMAMNVRITVFAKDEKTAGDACRAAYWRIGEIEQIASDYRKDSELSMLSTKADHQWANVSPEMWELLNQSLKLSAQSDGAFDITVGPYVQLWRAARKTKIMPPDKDLADAKTRVGYKLIELDPKNRSVKLNASNMKLDMGGIAKGYAGDQAIAVLKKLGITSALYEAGGDIVLGDPPPGEKGWIIEFDRPGRVLPPDMRLANCAISTSGDTEQFVIINNQRYSHVVDPRTGLGLTSRAMGTVVSTRGIDSDGLSKVCAILGPERAIQIITQYPNTRAFVRKVEE